MTLYFVGLGLNGAESLTLEGLGACKKSEKIFLENYTSPINFDVTELEKKTGKKVILAGRELVEEKSDKIISPARKEDVSFVVSGDVFCATTHIDLFLRAKKQGVNIKIFHNASIISAVGITGLQVYKFGRTVSIPGFSEKIESTKEYIKKNLSIGLHTLVLLDIELEVKNALDKLDIKKKIIVAERLGQDFKIHYDSAGNLKKKNYGKPPHSIIIPGELHFMEEEALKNLCQQK